MSSPFVRLPVALDRQLVRDLLRTYVTDRATPSALQSVVVDALRDAADELRGRGRIEDALWCDTMADLARTRCTADRDAEERFYLVKGGRAQDPG